MAAPVRVQVVSLFAAYGVAGLFWGAFAASAPEFQARAGLDAAGFGLALGAMPLTGLPAMQVFGRLLHRIEPLAIPIALGFFALGLVMLGLSRGMAGFVAALMVLGGASGALDIALNNRTARVEEATGLRLFNRTHALFPFAMLLASAGTGLVRDAGLAAAPLFAGLAVVFVAAAALEWGAGRGASPAAPLAGSGPARRAPLGFGLAVLAAIAALGAFQEASSQAWAAIFVETARGGSAAQGGLAAAAFIVGLSLGRLGAHELEHRLPPVATVRLAALLGAAGFAGLAADLPPGLLLPVFLLAGIGVGPVEPAVFRAVSRQGPAEGRGPRLATVTGVAYLGYLLSPPVLGLIADVAGYPALWLAAGIAALVVVALTLLLPVRAAPGA